jgi:hypothetical protein
MDIQIDIIATIYGCAEGDGNIRVLHGLEISVSLKVVRDVGCQGLSIPTLLETNSPMSRTLYLRALW